MSPSFAKRYGYRKLGRVEVRLQVEGDRGNTVHHRIRHLCLRGGTAERKKKTMLRGVALCQSLFFPFFLPGRRKRQGRTFLRQNIIEVGIPRGRGSFFSSHPAPPSFKVLHYGTIVASLANKLSVRQQPMCEARVKHP